MPVDPHSLAPLAMTLFLPNRSEGTVRLGFDAGVGAAGEPVIWGVLNAGDLARLPIERLSALATRRSDDDGDPVFFVGADGEAHLYFDTDVFPDMIGEIGSMARAAGLGFEQRIGDLELICGYGQDVLHHVPAFVHADIERMPTEDALALLATKGVVFRREPEVRDDSGPQP